MDVPSAAERRLAGRGVIIHDDEWPDIARPEHDGFAQIIDPGDGSLRVNFLIRPGTGPEDRAAFAEWAESRLDRFFEHGPEPDGWHWVEAVGGWQLWTRWMQMPEL
ncbi:hypothetical protein [Streptomyces swartbergensis]|uniref:hypothetical protein n=1 Tax=Streptomyces swartbergensis TaxID=487165 RepID=UPI003828438C